MSVYKDIISVVDTVNKTAGEINPFVFDRNMGSISRGASKAIYYFPILASGNVSPETMSMVATNLEGSYMSFVSACFALTPAMKVKGDMVNVEDYLKLFHQNIGLQSKDDLMISLREGMEEFKMFPNESLNEANGSNISSILERNDNFKMLGNNGNFEISSSTNSRTGKEQYKIYQNKINDEKERFNSFRPSVVNVTVTFLIDSQPVNVTIPVGVKSVLHPVNSSDLCDHIMECVAGKGLVHNLIRYTTGELKSLGDILFGISNIKKRVTRNDDVSKWAEALEKRKNSNLLSRFNIFAKNDNKRPYLPNTSIIISMEDVAEIERVVGYNLIKDKARTIKFMKDNFLLSLVVTDDVTKTLYVMYDGHTSFIEIPYTTIKRENDKTKDVVDSLIKGIGMGMGRGI